MSHNQYREAIVSPLTLDTWLGSLFDSRINAVIIILFNFPEQGGGGKCAKIDSSVYVDPNSLRTSSNESLTSKTFEKSRA